MAAAALSLGARSAAISSLAGSGFVRILAIPAARHRASATGGITNLPSHAKKLKAQGQRRRA